MVAMISAQGRTIEKHLLKVILPLAPPWVMNPKLRSYTENSPTLGREP